MTNQPEASAIFQAGRLAQIVLTVGTLALAALVFGPFVSPILWTLILSYTLYPLYGRVLRATGGREALSAFLMCMVVTVGLLLPLLYLALLIAQDLAETISSLLTYLRQNKELLGEGWRQYPVIAGFVEQLQNLQRLTGTDLRSSLAEGVANLGGMMIRQFTGVMRNLVQAGIEFAVVLLASFYFFRDGERIVAWMQDVVPITPERQRLILRRFDEVLNGAVYGNTVVALLEGVIGGVAFWLVGLPSPVLWGAVMAMTAYLPLIGSGLVWAPAAIYFGFQGLYGRLSVLVVAGIGITVIDYLVRNIVVGRASKLHSLIMFFSVIGGIELFGLVGVVAGPFIIAVAVALLEAYRSDKAALVLSATEQSPREEPIVRGSGAG